MNPNYKFSNLSAIESGEKVESGEKLWKGCQMNEGQTGQPNQNSD